MVRVEVRQEVSAAPHWLRPKAVDDEARSVDPLVPGQPPAALAPSATRPPRWPDAYHLIRRPPLSLTITQRHSSSLIVVTLDAVIIADHEATIAH